MKKLVLLLCVLALAGCSKGPDIEGVWYFDYEKTRLPEFPNPQYESARLLIADVEPRYGEIKVEGNRVILGGAVCRVKAVNDAQGLVCDERGQTSTLGLYLEDGRLLVKPQDQNLTVAIFNRIKQDPYAIYGIDPNAPEVADSVLTAERVAEPSPDAALRKFVGYARTQSFNAFYDPDSVKSEGRYTSVKIILNYLEPQSQTSSTQQALSSAQWIAFDCPGSNYRLERYAMFSKPNGSGVTISDSRAYLDYQPEMKPVPPDSINQILYMRVCR